MDCIRCTANAAVPPEKTPFQLCELCATTVLHIIATSSDQKRTRIVMTARYGYRTPDERASAD